VSSSDYLDPVRESLMMEYRNLLAKEAVCVQLCGDCDSKQFPPQATCARCGSQRVTWIEVPTGRLVSTLEKVDRDGARFTAVVVDVGGCRIPARAVPDQHLAPGDEVGFVFPESAPRAAVVMSPPARTQ
jgi:uncharacterized OB-fold protein